MTVWPDGTKTKPHIPQPAGNFGPRKPPTEGASTFHLGTDMTGFSTICATEPGTVMVVGTPKGWEKGGVQVWIQHDGWFSKNFHMRTDSPLVRVGLDVPEVAALGRQGQTGVASGVHLHFEATPGELHYSNTGQIDPVPFLTDRIAAPAGGAASTPFPPIIPEEDDMQFYVRPTSPGKLANPTVMYQWDARPGGHLKALSALEWETIDYFRTRGFPVPVITGWTGPQLDRLIATVGVMELIPGAPFNGGRPTYKIIYAPGVEGYVPVHAQNLK